MPWLRANTTDCRCTTGDDSWALNDYVRFSSDVTMARGEQGVVFSGVVCTHDIDGVMSRCPAVGDDDLPQAVVRVS